jgi:hypothetical protein
MPGQHVAVVAIGGDDLVALLQRHLHADHHRLLADIEMAEAADRPHAVELAGLFLEAPDQQHVMQAAELFVLAQLGDFGIASRGGRLGGPLGGGFGGGLGGGFGGGFGRPFGRSCHPWLPGGCHSVEARTSLPLERDVSTWHRYGDSLCGQPDRTGDRK